METKGADESSAPFLFSPTGVRQPLTPLRMETFQRCSLVGRARSAAPHLISLAGHEVHGERKSHYKRLVRADKEIGDSVGWLQFLLTLGSP